MSGRWLATALVALAACRSTIDSDQVERAIARFFGEQLGPVDRVDCPADVAARAGAVFTCAIHFAASPPLTVRVTHDDQGNGHFALQESVVSAKAMAPRIAQWIKERVGVDAAVDCGAGVHPIPAAGYPCKAALVDGTHKTIVVRRDPEGELTWDVH